MKVAVALARHQRAGVVDATAARRGGMVGTHVCRLFAGPPSVVKTNDRRPSIFILRNGHARALPGPAFGKSGKQVAGTTRIDGK